MRRRNTKAWLVTWEGDHGREDTVALLLPARTAGSRVAELVTLLYANTLGTHEERIAQATIADWAERPYRVRQEARGGAEREGHLLCGGNPRLYARKVEHVTVENAGDGVARLTWREIEP